MNHDPMCDFSLICRLPSMSGDSMGHRPTTEWCHGCERHCSCDLIARVREDERETWYEAQSETWEQGYNAARAGGQSHDCSRSAAAILRAYAERTHITHPITEGCPRCDLTAALRACAVEIETNGGKP